MHSISVWGMQVYQIFAARQDIAIPPAPIVRPFVPQPDPGPGPRRPRRVDMDDVVASDMSEDDYDDEDGAGDEDDII